ncbi:PHB depolymerase family esterase [Streptomyces lunaelactis]|uniref:extracellular catalytic domain type 1 short-chain-length polyhydroxyalkanoate depolymerase n=1 Tax=Streptomyces lunaelactis TaxID=1535768 RepID=UPI001584B531|nr:PHB depolymerase family esterase [Streptomyces lunaelactis]NUK32867.1 PHB depolymerase family esterase [Streptomyces lunaelactis]NUK39770.1 PHB depolymerase family esterase [Streptomyces lunaelactis]NUK90671.1 PHB depolymerase family esterase [Streptomyces lunaelactis]NUL32916.1 PHB depolymerase family esterase [Streptomyces lunaelactis]
MPLHVSPPKPTLLRRAAGRTGAVLALLAATLWLGPAPAAHAAVPLERVSSFGANPGALNMYVYRPATLPAHPAVVVALHGCTQSAQVYADNSGLTTFADRHGFLLVFAETTSANNLNSCFNWFQATDIQRGQGEAASVRQMIAHAETAYGADAARTYVTGLSAGGGMTAVMLAAYPDVFEAGAVIAGLGYNCTKDTGAFTCMNPGVDRTPAVWAQRVRDAYPGYAGPWPRVAVWHGDNDPTVVPKNADELRDQWTAVHGVDQSPDRTSTIGTGQTRREQYLAGDGRVVVEVDRVPAIGHGTPVDPGSGPQQCGQTGTANFIDSICSGYWITEFFGLDGSAPTPGGLPAPAGLAATSATDTSITLNWNAVEGAASYAVYRDGARIATPSAAPFTDTGLNPGTGHDYSVAARDAAGAEGIRSGPLTATTTGGAAACWTTDNYHQVQAGRATTDGSYAYAKGSQQNMGLYNTFVTHTLKESPAGHYVVADGNCP